MVEFAGAAVADSKFKLKRVKKTLVVSLAKKTTDTPEDGTTLMIVHTASLLLAK